MFPQTNYEYNSWSTTLAAIFFKFLKDVLPLRDIVIHQFIISKIEMRFPPILICGKFLVFRHTVLFVYIAIIKDLEKYCSDEDSKIIYGLLL